MKKLSFILFTAGMFFTTNVFAQEKGDMTIGGHLIVAGEETQLFGIGAKFQVSTSDKIRLEASLSFFLPDKDDYFDITLNMWNYSANIHWLIGRNKFKFYPLIGLGVTGISAKVWGETASETYIGVNVGFGFEYILSEKLAINLEFRNLFIEEGYIIHSMLGLSYKLNSNNNRHRHSSRRRW
jgi:opacity protein-like surface antigen